jgi:hypothetical protein
MQTLDDLDEAGITRLIIRMRRRLAEAERRLPADPDEAGVIATILPTLRQIAATRPDLAPKLNALIAHYAPLAATAH